MKKLPKKLFIWIENPSTENEFFASSTDIADSVSGTPTEIVGIYHLKETVKVEKKVVVEAIKVKRSVTKP